MKPLILFLILFSASVALAAPPDAFDLLEWHKPLHGKVCAVEAVMWHNPPSFNQPSATGFFDGEGILTCQYGTTTLSANFIYPGPIPANHFYYELTLPTNWSRHGDRNKCLLDARIKYKDTHDNKTYYTSWVEPFHLHQTRCQKSYTTGYMKNSGDGLLSFPPPYPPPP